MTKQIKNPLLVVFSNALTNIVEVGSFVVLVMLYGLISLLAWIGKYFKPAEQLKHRAYDLVTKLDRQQQGSISRLELIDLAIANMKAKKTRTLITVGGMTIGIAAIVFLVSIGYGLQTLVINRVARLDEMRQTDITPQAGSKLRLNDESHATFKGMQNVEQALPMIAVVGKVNYNNSATDMAVYGVTHDYLEQSAIKPVSGEIFESNEIVVSTTVAREAPAEAEEEREAYEAVEAGETVRSIRASINSGKWLRVRTEASDNSELLGYTSSDAGQLRGEEIWGAEYADAAGNGTAGATAEGRTLGLWIRVRTPLWEEVDGRYLPMMDSNGNQVVMHGYLPEIDVTVSEAAEQQVLGDAIDITNDDWIEIEGESIGSTEVNIEKVTLPAAGAREAVVNRGFLEVLGISEDEVLGQTFEVSFIVTGTLLDDDQKRIQSEPAEYTVIGVTPDNKTPLFYVPFTDLRMLGVTNFSQIKLVAGDQEDLPIIRRQIEGLGYATHSVSDTVAQINNLFSTARLLLALLGMVALSVAALGMFNTLTVSLLERTREVGLLKSMGMKSREVRDLFLAESMVMGSMGGILGIIFGLLAGKAIELLLTLFAVSKGAGFITIVDIPLAFALVIIFLSFMVGILTGLYPAKRATKISALNALRYE